MRFAFIAALCLMNISLVAQTFRTQDHQMGVDIFLADYTGPKYVDVEGSPYINDNYLPAKISNINKTQFIRLNCVDHIIEVKSDNDSARILDFDHIDYEIKFSDGSNRNYITSSYIDSDGNTAKSFFEVVEKNKSYSLLKKERKVFIRKQDVEGYTEKKPARFLAVDDAYYITDFKTGSNLLIEIPRKKKKFIAFFLLPERALEKFIKQEKLDFKKEEDLTLIVESFFENME